MKRIFLILLLIPILSIGQSRKKQIESKDYQIDSLDKTIKELRSYIQVLDNDYTSKIYTLEKSISEYRESSYNKDKLITNLKNQITNLNDTIYVLKKKLDNPYKLSEGVINDLLFSFIKSVNFKEMGKENLYHLININKISIDSNIVIDFNQFSSQGACVDNDLIWNKDIFYFTEGKVLIIQSHYDGDFESKASDWYDFFLYDSKQLKFKEVFSTSLIFEYNYDTDYIVSKYTDPCGGEDYFLIYNNKLEMVKNVDPWNDQAIDSDKDYTVSWNINKSNDLNFINNNKVRFRVYENKNKEWTLLK